MTYLSERQNVKAGTLLDLDSQAEVTVLRDWNTLIIPACRLDAAGLAALRVIINGEEPELAAVHAELAGDEAAQDEVPQAGDGEREHIAAMSDPDLVAYLHRTASEGDIASYRAAYHEAVTVRGAAGIPESLNEKAKASE